MDFAGAARCRCPAKAPWFASRAVWNQICIRASDPDSCVRVTLKENISMATMVETPPRTDASIREAVIAELKWDPKVTSPDDIAVAVRDGVVTLSGFVHSYWEKDAAEKAAKRVYGVKGFANDIEVKLPGTRTDPEIAREAVQGIQNHISLPADRIKVTVRSGWVTLEGSVDWQYQRALAESAVKNSGASSGSPIRSR